jgi:glycerol-3-phosphate dehydrogenase
MRHLSKKATLKSFRSGKPGAIKGGIAFYEGQLDDARHTMMIARTAADYGAVVASSTRVTEFLRDGDTVIGAVAHDLESGREITIRARATINAAGVWTDDIQNMVGDTAGFKVRASKGVHVLVPRDRIDSDTGLITETAKSLLFIIPCPWSDEFWILGTTDTQWDLDRAHPAASRADIDYILGEANKLLDTPLTRDDVVGVYAGLRPLLAGESDETSTLSREHACVSPVPGLVIIAGGKYTTYRVMAKDAVDLAAKALARPVPACVTDRVPLVGAAGYEALVNTRERLAAQSGLSVERIDHLLGRYGSAVREVLDLVAERPELGEPLEHAPRYLKVEAYYGASHEGALHLDDLLARRLRVSIDTWDRGVDVAREVAEIVAPVLGWDERAIEREVEHYRVRVEAERDSQEQLDDRTADSARLGAPEVRVGVGS